jgi:natural resistance-associated macrophage protein
LAIIPCFFIAIGQDIMQLSELNDWLNAVMSFQAPFALIPTITFCSSYQVMGEFRAGW